MPGLPSTVPIASHWPASLKAKPFPSRIRIGIDIVHIPRFHRLLSEKADQYLSRWARIVFNPQLELTVWKEKFEQLRADPHKLADIARFMAGRWALKEAAIKAHSARQLSLNDVSIISRHKSVGRGNLALKPDILIDPPPRRVHMKLEVAKKRGLQEAFQENPETRIFTRPALIFLEDRQHVDGNLSHDGQYAIAVVQALDEAPSDLPIWDHGEGPLLHEEIEGDRIPES